MAFIKRIAVLGAALALLSTSVFADVHVKGHFRGGTWVQPHYRSNPNSTPWDNWSTIGNINPRTGKHGWIVPGGSRGSFTTGYTPSYEGSEDGYDPFWRMKVKAKVEADWEKRRGEVKARNLAARARYSKPVPVSVIGVASVRGTKRKLPPLSNRKWTSDNGNYSETAILHSVSLSNVVRLYRISDGKKLKIDLDELSIEDREYVREMLAIGGDLLRPYYERSGYQVAQTH